MMGHAPVRCPAPHPDKPGAICNARLMDAEPDSVELLPAEQKGRGMPVLQCWRCRATHVVCIKAA